MSKKEKKGDGLKGIECRGRNGWFNYDNYFVAITPALENRSAYVEINSRRKGKHAPITITGKPSSVIELLEDISYKLKVMSASLAWEELKMRTGN